MRLCRHMCILVLLLSPCCLGARAFRVRQLGDPTAHVWGTDEFEVTVTPLGLVRHIRVGGEELVWQGVSLYTFPYASATGDPIRTVQGEGYGDRGLSIIRPEMSHRDVDGTHVWEFDHQVAAKAVLDGQPLCRVHQRVSVTPTGEIDVTYDCEWLETLRWSSFMVLILFDKAACQGKSFLALETEDLVHVGLLDSSTPGQGGQRIRNVAFKQLSIRPAPGPFHVLWTEPADCSFHWTSSLELRVAPRGLPRHGPIPKGHRARIGYRFLLPVSQE